MNVGDTTYTPPVFVVNMTLVNSPTDLVLVGLRDVFETVDHLHVAVNVFRYILNDLRSDAAPKTVNICCKLGGNY